MLRRIVNLQKIILFFLTTVFAVFSHADQTQNKKEVPVYTTENKTILATADQPQFTIKLSSNPTTGYSWFLHEYDHTLLTSVKHSYESANGKLIGASGFEYWTFQVTPIALSVPHDFIVRFNYARPWQNTDSVTQVMFRVYTK